MEDSEVAKRCKHALEDMHASASEAPTMAVCVPTAIKCSNGSVFPSKVGRWGVLKPSGTRVSHNTCDRGWDSMISSSFSCPVALFAFSCSIAATLA
ncbi:hypothetical protein A2U01_0008649 [Trifolium medium]|uniref:Uncharacterized protein n=1 Tax=Trifolium medium TaxID=97028 RepID=A0A392MK82_9FABA|nr:hypothetical protein [Trifolium medium]